MRRPMNVDQTILQVSVVMMRRGDHDDSNVPFVCELRQKREVPSEQYSRFTTPHGVVLMHRQQTVHHDQTGLRDGDFSAQPFDLVIELVQREPPAQKQP